MKERLVLEIDKKMSKNKEPLELDPELGSLWKKWILEHLNVKHEATSMLYKSQIYSWLSNK